MIRNYLRIFIRNCMRFKGITFINITGLTLGMVACILIFQYISFELSYDNFHEKGERIYRVRYDAYKDGALQFESAAAVPALGPAMKSDFPEVQDFARLSIDQGYNFVFYTDVITNRRISLKVEKIHYADPSFLSMFSFPLLRGNPDEALKKPFSAVISQNVSRKFFGNDDPLDKELFIFGRLHKVTGVFEDVPVNSHVKFNILLDIAQMQADWISSWHWDDFYTYVLLAPGTNPEVIDAKFPEFSKKYRPKMDCSLKLQSLGDIHLHSDLQVEAEKNGDYRFVTFFILVGIIILIIAWINYTNLSTARVLDRAKEIGIRKVSGANRVQLARQFLFESLLINLVSAALAVVVVTIFQKYFEYFTGKTVPAVFLSYSPFLGILILLFVVGALLSGSYPAFILSTFQPALVLKGKLSRSIKGTFIRKALVIFQFVVSIALISGTFIVYKQLAFMENYDLGINIGNTLVLRGPQVPRDQYLGNYNAFKTELLRYNLVKAISASSNVPGKEIDWTRGIRKLGDADDNNTRVYNLTIDSDFVPIFGLKVIAGRNFSDKFGEERMNVLLNRCAVEALGFESPKRALTQQLTPGGPVYKIIGVVENFHNLSLRNHPGPMVFYFDPAANDFYSIKIDNEHFRDTIFQIKEKWGLFFPEEQFDYFSLEEFFKRQYEQERLFGRTFSLFTLLAIFIACLGLLGLTYLSVVQRTKEVGVRKVFGASPHSIYFLFSKDFIRLIGIAALLAVPLCWYILSQWLQNYVYRIHIQVWIFIAPVAIILIIAFITIMFQVTKAVRTNPIESLRYE